MPDPATRFLREALSDPHWPDFQLDARSFAARLRAVEPRVFADALDAFYSMYAARFDKPRWGDKTPAYLDCMSDLARWYPAARFIHIIRDGRDVALSVREQPFGPNSYPEAARRWVERIENGRRQARELRHYIELRYEDLVSDPESQLHRVCDSIELDWHPAMLRYHERAACRLAEDRRDLRLRRGVTLAAAQRIENHKHVLDPPNRGRIGQWSSRMSAAEQREFVAIAGELLASLGYAS